MILNELDIKTTTGMTVGQIVFSPLLLKGISPKIIDLGARSGMFELPESYTSQADFIGFEPNQIEYEKLLNMKTDSILAGGRQPKFKSQKFYPTAIWSSECEQQLNITVGAGACSLSGDVDERITCNMYLEGRQQSSYHDSVQKVQATIHVPCVSLDSILKHTDIVDYLKVDVEGGELEVFKGAKSNLAAGNILFIKTEFLLTPYYENRVLLGHQHVYLDQMGYRLIDFDLSHLRYLREPSNIPKCVDRRPSYAGDAFFMLDPDLNTLEPITKHRLGVMLLTFGFRSLALSMLKEANLLSATEFRVVTNALTYVPWHKKLKTTWMNFPYKVWPILRKLGLFQVK